MPRVSAQHAAKIAGVDRSTLHRWARTGRLTRYDDGYDMDELLKAVESRDLDALLLRAGKSEQERAYILRYVQRHQRVA